MKWQPQQEKEHFIDKKEDEDITAYIGTTAWTRLAKDRKTCKDHEEEGYNQLGIDTAEIQDIPHCILIFTRTASISDIV